MVLFAANAVLWWGWGPAVERGWATNSDFYIRRNFGGFSFILGLPIFTAIIMGDPVIRDFRLGVDSIIFSKPVHRASYLLGKFFGNFFVLVCCQSAFAITLFLLQWVPFSGMVTLPVRVTPYFKHFFIGVVITHLVLAAVYFAAGTLTRNAKVVYGLAVCFYPVFIGYQFLLRELPPVFRVLLDPVGFNSGSRFDPWSQSADFLNQYVVHYGLSAYANRASMIIISALVLLLVYLRFAIESPNKRSEHFTKLPLSEIPDRIAYSGPSYGLVDLRAVDKSEPRPAIGTLAVVRFERVRKFAAIAYNEVLLNSKRVAPCVMALLCAGNGLLWWGWGPATGRGWAVNSDAFIAFALPAYSFMMLPLLTAVFMADPVIRDFRAEINPLIFSKPVSRAEYLLGKFFGSFFVLACGQSAFVVMWFVLQAVPKQGVVTHGFRVIPYIKHFLVFVVITHLTFAAVSFTVGTLTRNAKIGYGLGVLFYPLIAAYNIVLLNSLPMQWRAVLDPLLMRWEKMEHSSSAEYVNHHIVVYDADLMVNRAAMILIAAICLAILYVRFSTSERSGPSEKLSVLNLSTAVERVYYPERSLPIAVDESERTDFRTDRMLTSAAVPEVVRVNEGIRANANKLITALGVEFRLLYAERSLVVIMPLSIFFSILEVAFYNILPHVSQSAAYATNTAKLLLPILPFISLLFSPSDGPKPLLSSFPSLLGESSTIAFSGGFPDSQVFLEWSSVSSFSTSFCFSTFSSISPSEFSSP